MKNNKSRNKEIFALIMWKLMSNNNSFTFETNKIDVKGIFKISIYQESQVEIVTNTYHKDFRFLNDVSDAFILDIIDRILNNY